MDQDLNTNTILVAIVVLAVLYWVYTQRAEKWTSVKGVPLDLAPLPRDRIVCDTGYNDDSCKFTAVNCFGNPHSYWYQNE
jgi:hypothetical protein